MGTLNIEQALENIYSALENDNEDIDAYIKELKEVLASNKSTKVEVDQSRLVQNNREGRKRMQSYFKKRGVIITFAR